MFRLVLVELLKVELPKQQVVWVIDRKAEAAELKSAELQI
jgi:hypothetical protein